MAYHVIRSVFFLRMLAYFYTSKHFTIDSRGALSYRPVKANTQLGRFGSDVGRIDEKKNGSSTLETWEVIL